MAPPSDKPSELPAAWPLSSPPRLASLQLISAGACATVSHRAPHGVFHGCDDCEEAEFGVSELLRSIPSSAAAYVVQYVVRLRQVVARAAVSQTVVASECSLCERRGLSLLVEQCGCVVCEQARSRLSRLTKLPSLRRIHALRVPQCLWRGLVNPPAGRDRGEILCVKVRELEHSSSQHTRTHAKHHARSTSLFWRSAGASPLSTLRARWSPPWSAM